MPSSFSRRSFFQRTLAWGTVLLAPVLLTACGGSEAPASDTDETTAHAREHVQATCDSETELGTRDNGIRKALAYVEDSPHTDKDCANCKFFKAAAGEVCGGCEIIAGPIAAAGYCNSWVARTA